MSTKQQRRRQRRIRILIVAAGTALVGILIICIAFGLWSALTKQQDGSGSSSGSPGTASGQGSSTVSTSSGTSGQTDPSSSSPSTTSATSRVTTTPDGHYLQPEGADWNLVLANDWNPLPADFDNTYTREEFYRNGNGQQFDNRAIEHLRAMINAANAEDPSMNIRVLSAYRSVALQKSLYDRKVNELIGQGLSREDAEVKAATIVKRPGTSEHNTGLAVDVGGSGDYSIEESFANTKAYRWLKAHCAEYGFILRFPKEKEDVTGVIYEPWHYRYVGVEHAKVIMERGICLEEYLQELGK